MTQITPTDERELEIFRAGTHTSASGVTLAFSQDDLNEIASTYDPSNHEAPVVVGHPKDNGPAFGWIKEVKAVGDRLVAKIHQLNPDFVEAVKNKAYKKVSASFYPPSSPNNPTPGKWSLRHLGFLGAQPPAVKGLTGFVFNEEDDAIEFEEELDQPVEFCGMGWGLLQVVDAFQGIREWIIEEYDLDKAEKVLPKALLGMLQYEAQMQRMPMTVKQDDSMESDSESDYSDLADRVAALQQASEVATEFGDYGSKDAEMSSDMTAEEKKTKRKKKKAMPMMDTQDETNLSDLDASVLEQKLAEFQEMERRLAVQEKMIAKREAELAAKLAAQYKNELVAFADQLYADGRMVPAIADKEDLIQFMVSLAGDAVEFSDGNQLKPVDYFKQMLGRMPKFVTYGEYAPPEKIMAANTQQLPVGQFDSESMYMHQQAVDLCEKKGWDQFDTSKYLAAINIIKQQKV